MFRLCIALLVLTFTAGCGCGGAIKRPTTSDLVVAGRVFRAADSGGSSPFAGADVRVSCDRNKNGALEAEEVVSTTTDDEGNYSLAMKVEKGERVVVRFSGSGAAPMFKTVDAGPWAELALNATLRGLESLECDSATQRCALDGNKLSLDGLGEGVSGSARVFNPERETRAFPGAFDDSDGNLLISGVFGAVQLEDQNGEPLETLAAPVDMRMRIPQETWFQIVDLTPGDDRIQIPLYSFNEVSGEWVREKDGFLETSTGAIIPESKLAEIRAGTFSEGVLACGKVSHFSYWNVDWPIETKQCITGVVVGDDGKPAEGATVQISGMTYTGQSDAITVGPDGRFCAEVMRSEAPGERVDNDDAAGETQRIRIRVFYGGKIYDGGEHDVPTTSATCGGGGCLDVGNVELATGSEIVPELCTVKGKVTDAQGTAIEGVALFFNDPSVPKETSEDLCGFASLNCTLFAVSREDGSYEVTTPMLDGATLFAFSSERNEAEQVDVVRLGLAETDGCPERNVDLKMTDGYATVQLMAAVSGQQISWTPARAIHQLIVMSAAGEVKWLIATDDPAGFSGPVTYGVVPPNAAQATPEQGAPVALVTGDEIILSLTGEYRGSPLVGSGAATVP